MQASHVMLVTSSGRGARAISSRCAVPKELGAPLRKGRPRRNRRSNSPLGDAAVGGQGQHLLTVIGLKLFGRMERYREAVSYLSPDRVFARAPDSHKSYERIRADTQTHRYR